MAVERPIPLRPTEDLVRKIRGDLDRALEAFDMRAWTQEVERFGRERPFPMALAALTVGVASGILMRRVVSSSERR